MNTTTGYLHINLISKYQDTNIEIENEFNKFKSKIKGFKEEHEGLKIGDTIEFVAGYNNDIMYTTKILGFDFEGDIYLLWDCYWAPIRFNDKARQIKKL